MNNNTIPSSEMGNDHHDDTDEEYTYMASTTQQLIVSSLQIPSCLLSLIGSSLIIINVRRIRKKTPYRRILLLLSACDILSTIGWLLQPFLADASVPNAWVWSVGNQASCVLLGSLTQFGTPSAHLYSLLLAVYFLLTVRFGMTERTFAQKYERLAHSIIWLFCVSTAMAGVGLGIFRPNILAPGCWISAPPEGCSEECPEAKWAWLFGGLPAILTLFGISISNIMLYLHVRRTVMEGEKRALANEQRLLASFPQESGNDANDTTHHETSTSSDHADTKEPYSKPESTLSLATSTKNPKTAARSVLRSSDKQWKRVQEVGKQAFLYVGAYFLSFSWSFALNYLDSMDYEYQRGSEHVLFPLLVLQAIFAPIFGLLTCLIFFRPKYKAARIKFPDEPVEWVVQQVVMGADRNGRFTQRPTSAGSSSSTTTSHRNKGQHGPKQQSWATRINFAGERLSSNSGSMKWSSRSWFSSNHNPSNSSFGRSLQAIDESQEEARQSDKKKKNGKLSSNEMELPDEIGIDVQEKKEEAAPRTSKKMEALNHHLITMSDDDDDDEASL